MNGKTYVFLVSAWLIDPQKHYRLTTTDPEYKDSVRFSDRDSNRRKHANFDIGPKENAGSRFLQVTYPNNKGKLVELTTSLEMSIEQINPPDSFSQGQSWKIFTGEPIEIEGEWAEPIMLWQILYDEQNMPSQLLIRALARLCQTKEKLAWPLIYEEMEYRVMTENEVQVLVNFQE